MISSVTASPSLKGSLCGPSCGDMINYYYFLKYLCLAVNKNINYLHFLKYLCLLVNKKKNLFLKKNLIYRKYVAALIDRINILHSYLNLHYYYLLFCPDEHN